MVLWVRLDQGPGHDMPASVTLSVVVSSAPQRDHDGV